MQSYIPGQLLVHPAHGPLYVTAVTSRNIRGRIVRYVDARTNDGLLTISFPPERSSSIGIRPLFDEGEIEKIFEEMLREHIAEEAQWSRRLKATAEKLASNEPLVRAAVARDLLRRKVMGGLSLAERDQLNSALRPLLSEIRLVLKIDEDTATRLVYMASVEGKHPFSHENNLGDMRETSNGNDHE